MRSVKWLSTYPCPKDQTAWWLENDMASGVSLLGACRMILLACLENHIASEITGRIGMLEE